MTTQHTDSQINEMNDKLKTIHSKPIDLAVQIKEGVPYPVDIVLDTNSFLRTLNKFGMLFVFVSLIMVVVLTAALAYTASRPPITLSYALDPDNRLVLMEPIQTPIKTQEDVLIYAAETATALLKVSFVDTAEHFEEMERVFVNRTIWNRYRNEMDESATLQRIRDFRLVSWAEPSGAPRIVEYDAQDVNWTVEIPLVWYMGGGNVKTQGFNINVTMDIYRVKRTQNLVGLQVGRFAIREN